MPAAALNAFHTIYLRHVLELSGAQSASLYTMNVYNHPLPRTAEGEVWIAITIISRTFSVLSIEMNRITWFHLYYDLFEFLGRCC